MSAAPTSASHTHCFADRGGKTGSARARSNFAPGTLGVGGCDARDGRDTYVPTVPVPSEPPEQSLGPHQHDAEVHREDDGVLVGGVEEQPPERLD